MRNILLGLMLLLPTSAFASLTNTYVPVTCGGTVSCDSNIISTGGLVSIGTTDTSNAAITIQQNLTTTSPLHTLRDQSNINISTSGSGYAAIDIQPTMSGSSSYDHFIGLQSRPIYSGSGGITTRFDTIYSGGTHSGAGTVNSYSGMHIADVGGGGTVTTDYGLQVDNIARGGDNYAIKTSGGKHLFAGNVSIQTSTAGQPLDIAYPAAKTVTSLSPALQIQSDEGSGFTALSIGMQGGSVQSSRTAVIQTSEDGGSNDGVLALQPSGGDVYSVALFDYFSSSTIQGWSSPSGNILVKKIGKWVYVNYSIWGTSNSNSISFSLPYTNSSATGSGIVVRCGYALDNTNSVMSDAYVSLAPSASTAAIYVNPLTGGWTSTGFKIVNGQFMYQQN